MYGSSGAFVYSGKPHLKPRELASEPGDGAGWKKESRVGRRCWASWRMRTATLGVSSARVRQASASTVRHSESQVRWTCRSKERGEGWMYGSSGAFVYSGNPHL